MRKRKSGGGKPFTKGRSGNPKGRPKGSLNKSTIFNRVLLQSIANLEAQHIPSVLASMRRNGERRNYMKSLNEIFRKLVPDLRAIELSGPGGGAIPLDLSPVPTATLEKVRAILAKEGEARG